MTVVAVTSSRTSPGATTLATGLAVTWTEQARRSLLIEADPAGGVLALRFDLAPAPSLTSFGSDIRHGFEPELLWKNTQDLRGVHCLPAPVDPVVSRSWIARVTDPLVAELPRLGAPTVIDLGWVDHDGPSLQLAAAADITLVVTRPDVAEVQALLFQVRRLRAAGANVAIVTVGDTPNDPSEISALADAPLAAVLPDDPAIAAALTGAKFSPARVRRSLLWRTIGGLAEALFDEAAMTERAAEHGASAHGERAPMQVPPPPTTSMIAPPSLVPPPLLAPAQTFHPVDPADLVTPSLDTVNPAPVYSAAFDKTVELEPRLVAAELLRPDGAAHPLDNEVVIGRHRDCDIVVSDSRASRRHVRIARADDGWHFADLGSSNGTRLNGHRCSAGHLSSGDVLHVGQTLITFQVRPVHALETECA